MLGVEELGFCDIVSYFNSYKDVFLKKRRSNHGTQGHRPTLHLFSFCPKQ